ncbi:hypothetical protein [Bosea sp. 685]|uniref:hypothetical protein n=1 Tax=Bosea sp. 685 TaxID=3080057 RepID=UPI002892FB32|nr:hypothetical protein [Bosea sp. 685]WNJ91910.1 hypothetical protein RMR04_06285 [Bosea sp. 685]
MTEATDTQIDEAILSELEANSLKTARIMVLVGKRFHASDPSFLDRVEARIGVLIEAGSVKLYGNLANWRRSELALMPSDG